MLIGMMVFLNKSRNSRAKTMDTNKSYAAQVATHLIICKAGVLGVLVLVIYVLAFFAGSAGSSVNGNAINIERNSITIALSEEPPQLDLPGLQMHQFYSSCSYNGRTYLL